jgi:hypothetical protein
MFKASDVQQASDPEMLFDSCYGRRVEIRGTTSDTRLENNPGETVDSDSSSSCKPYVSYHEGGVKPKVFTVSNSFTPQ